MSPGELIYFFAIGFVVIVASIVLWFIFRRRKKLAITLASMLVIGYIGYFLYYPTLKTNTHTEAYETVSKYLEKAIQIRSSLLHRSIMRKDIRLEIFK